MFRTRSSSILVLIADRLRRQRPRTGRIDWLMDDRYNTLLDDETDRHLVV